MTTTENTQAAEWAAALDAAPRGEIVIYLDPNIVVFGDNVRTEASVDREFIASIREHGFIQYPAAFLNDDGEVQILAGQRRILGARAAGLTEVPVILRRRLAEEDADAAAREFERITKQFSENKMREDMTTAEEAAAVEQVLNLGVTPAKAAKKLGMSTDAVKTVRTVSKSATARELATADQLTFDQAAAVIEFEDDPKAVARLIHAAGTGQFEHTAQVIRAERQAQAAYRAAAAEFAERGFSICETRPYWRDFGTYTPFHYLRTAEGSEPTEADVRDPAHWAVLLEEAEQWRHIESGDVVDEIRIDWATEDEPETEPAEGLHHLNEVRSETVWTPAYYCTDPAAAGLTSTYDNPTRKEPETVDPAEAQRETEAQREAARAERRRTIAANKLAKAATVVRRAWVSEKLTGTKPFKGAAMFAAQLMCADATLISAHSARELAAELLGMDATSAAATLASTAETLTAKGGDNRAQVMLFALAAAAVEARMQPRKTRPEDERPDYWRIGQAATGQGWMGYETRTRQMISAYLLFLRELGYSLSPVERVAAGELTVDEAITEAQSEAAEAALSDE
ncbi:ParB/RepB/Spo0J family partition protein [Nocardia rhamnosiphila]